MTHMCQIRHDMAGGRPKLTDRAKALFDPSGIGVKNAISELHDQLKRGGTREDVANWAQRRQLLFGIAADFIRPELASKEHDQLVLELRETRAAMKNQGLGGTSFNSDNLSLPRRPGEGDFTQ